MNIEPLFPHSPDKGPPVPRLLPPWPWVKSNNPVRIAYKELDATLDRLTEEKRKEWLAKYPDRPGLVEKALLWAREWASGMISSSLYLGVPEEVKENISMRFYKTALDRADRWIDAFYHS